MKHSRWSFLSRYGCKGLKFAITNSWSLTRCTGSQSGDESLNCFWCGQSHAGQAFSMGWFHWGSIERKGVWFQENLVLCQPSSRPSSLAIDFSYLHLSIQSTPGYRNQFGPDRKVGAVDESQLVYIPLHIKCFRITDWSGQHFGDWFELLPAQLIFPRPVI